jgi:hypothetical protein
MTKIPEDIEEYKCSCGKTHKKYYRGKVSQTFLNHWDKRLDSSSSNTPSINGKTGAIASHDSQTGRKDSKGDEKDDGQVDEDDIFEDRPEVCSGVEVRAAWFDFVENNPKPIHSHELDRMLPDMTKKVAQNIVSEISVYGNFGEKAIWRLSEWETTEGKQKPFNLDELRKYDILIAAAKGEKMGRKRKKQWKKHVKQNVK